MTINTNLSRVQYDGNSVTTAFPFASRVLEDSHLRVLRQVIATGVVTELILNSGGADGFSVAGVGGDSCTVNVVTAPKLYTDPDGERLTILRNVPLTQTADYVENDPFPAQTHENALDKLTMIEQQQDDQITRSAKLPETSAVGLNVVLPQTPVNNRALKWDGTTGTMKNSDNDPDQLVADVSGLVDTATNAASTATTQAGISTTQAGLSQQYAQGVPSEPAGFSAKYWRDQAAAFAAPANNWAGTRDPLPTDDFAAGYTNGSYWVNTVVSPKEAFVCIDQTIGAAVWIKTTLTIDELQPLLDAKVDKVVAPVTRSTLAYTLVLGDKDQYLRCAATGAMTVTVPPNSSVAFPIGAEIGLYWAVSATTSLEVLAGAGVSIRVASGFSRKLRVQWSNAVLKKVNTDEWLLVGDLEYA